MTDLNYGGHVGNDTFLSFLHEVRVQFLGQQDFSEQNAGGCGLILSRLEVEYLAQAFHGDELICEVAATHPGPAGFDLVYQIRRGDTSILRAMTKMVCFDYERQKVCRMPEELRETMPWTVV